MGKYDELLAAAPSDNSAPQQAQAPSQPSADSAPPSPPSGGSKYGDLLSAAPPAPPSNDMSALPGMPAHGDAPETAIQESPLGIMQRAMLGWVRTPQEQQKYLQANFDDVAPVATASGGQSFAVKTKGKWFDVNPDMEWSLSDSNIKNGLGKMAQDAGEYGIRGAAAAALAAPGMEAGMAAGAPLGPIGMAAGATIGAMGAGAIGAMGAEGGDLAARQALPAGAPGRQPYDADQANKQLLASAMWGANTAVISKSMDLGASATAGKLGDLIKYMTNTSPDGSSAVKSFLTSLGANDNLVEARLANPAQNAGLDKIAASDAKASYFQGTPKLDAIQESAVDGIHADLNAAIQKQGAEFQRLKTVAQNSTNFDTSAPMAKAISDLQDAQLVTPKLQVVPNRVVGESDKQAIDYLTSNLPTAKGLTYDEARARVGDLNNLIGESKNANIQRILIQTRDGFHSQIAQGLDEISPGTGQQYGSIINNYSSSKAMKDALDQVTDGNKRFAFTQKLLKENPNATKSVIGDMIDNGVNPDNITKTLQAEGSRQAQSWFGNGKIMNYIPTPGPKLGAKIISGGAEASDAVQQAAAPITPYLNHAVNWVKNLDGATRQSMMTNPAALQSIQGIIGGAVQGETSLTSQLMSNVPPNPGPAPVGGDDK